MAGDGIPCPSLHQGWRDLCYSDVNAATVIYARDLTVRSIIEGRFPTNESLPELRELKALPPGPGSMAEFLARHPPGQDFSSDEEVLAELDGLGNLRRLYLSKRGCSVCPGQVEKATGTVSRLSYSRLSGGATPRFGQQKREPSPSRSCASRVFRDDELFACHTAGCKRLRSAISLSASSSSDIDMETQ